MGDLEEISVSVIIIFKGFKSWFADAAAGFTYAKGRELYCHTCFLTRKESFGDTAFIFFTTFTENSK